MRLVGRNQQPVPSFYIDSLATDNRLSPVFAGHRAIFIHQIFSVFNPTADNHLSGAAGEHIKVIYAGVLFGVVPDTINLGQAQHRLFPVDTVEHVHAEVTALQIDGTVEKRLTAAATRPTDQSGSL